MRNSPTDTKVSTGGQKKSRLSMAPRRGPWWSSMVPAVHEYHMELISMCSSECGLKEATAHGVPAQAGPKPKRHSVEKSLQWSRKPWGATTHRKPVLKPFLRLGTMAHNKFGARLEELQPVGSPHKVSSGNRTSFERDGTLEQMQRVTIREQQRQRFYGLIAPSIPLCCSRGVDSTRQMGRWF